MAKYFKRRWDEAPGDEHDDWGCSWWLFEVDESDFPTRQLEIYDTGPIKRYGPALVMDADGQLSSAAIDEADGWAGCRISAEEFEAAWAHAD